MSSTEPETLRLLVVLASPTAAPEGVGLARGAKLDVVEAWTKLRSAIENTCAPDRKNAYPVHWHVYRCYPQSARALHMLLRTGYQIVHFNCHGDPNTLYLEDGSGNELPYSSAQMVADLRDNGVELIVLVACDSRQIGLDLVKAKAVPCAIVTCKAIQSSHVQIFTRLFYEQLALGKTAAAAFAIAHKGAPDPAAWELIGDGNSFRPRRHPQGYAAGPPTFIQSLPTNSLFPFGQAQFFVGRRQELIRIGEWLDSQHFVMVLSGPGGAGKTALAVQSALRFQHRFRALVFVSAKDLPNFGPADVLEALREALRDVSGPLPVLDDGQNVIGSISRCLYAAPVLLILDNFETIRPQLAVQIGQAISRIADGSGSKVLVTTRPVQNPALTDVVHGQNSIALGKLRSEEALALIYNAWRKANGRFPPDNVAPEEASRLTQLHRDAGLPRSCNLLTVKRLNDLAKLAFRYPGFVRLAGSLAAKWGYESAHKRLRQMTGTDLSTALTELIGTMVESLEKQHPRALIALHAALPFVGGFEEEHLRYVAGVEDDIRFQDEYLGPAEQASLLNRRYDRYEMDAPVRAYLEYQRPPEPSTMAEFQQRHAEALLKIADKYRDAPTSMPYEWGNISAAIEHLLQQIGTAGNVPQSLARLLVDHVLRWRSVLVEKEPQRCRTWLGKARDAARKLGERETEALILQTLGDLVRPQNLEAAEAYYKNALELFREKDARVAEAIVLRSLGELAHELTDTDSAFYYYGEAARLFFELVDHAKSADVYGKMAELHKQREEYEAATWCRTIASLLLSLSASNDASSTYRTMAKHFEERGQHEAAASCLTRAEQIHAELSHSLLAT